MSCLHFERQQLVFVLFVVVVFPQSVSPCVCHVVVITFIGPCVGSVVSSVRRSLPRRPPPPLRSADEVPEVDGEALQLPPEQVPVLLQHGAGGAHAGAVLHRAARGRRGDALQRPRKDFISCSLTKREEVQNPDFGHQPCPPVIGSNRNETFSIGVPVGRFRPAARRVGFTF